MSAYCEKWVYDSAALINGAWLSITVYMGTMTYTTSSCNNVGM